jgi:anionic cell wall polymer biosynthesis LytR-Cps2A-Psr (LCP) family protein
MNGVTALCYVRSRFSTNDFDRIRRQHEVLEVMLARLLRPRNLARLPEWYLQFKDTVQTDMSLAEILSRLPAARQIFQKDGISHFQIGNQQVSSVRLPLSGADVLLPKPDAIRSVLEEAARRLAEPPGN